MSHSLPKEQASSIFNLSALCSHAWSIFRNNRRLNSDPISLSELLKDSQADINTTVKLEKKLKDEKFIDDLKAVLKSAKNGFTNAAGHALHRLNEVKPNIDAVKELIRGFTDALTVKKKDAQLPIQSANWNCSMILSNMFLFSQTKESNMKMAAKECVVVYWLLMAYFS